MKAQTKFHLPTVFQCCLSQETPMEEEEQPPGKGVLKWKKREWGLGRQPHTPGAASAQRRIHSCQQLLDQNWNVKTSFFNHQILQDWQKTCILPFM